MAIEKVGIYRKWLEAVPKDEHGNPISKSQWTKKRRHRWIVRWYGTTGQRYGKVFKTRKEAESYTHQLQARVDIGKADMPQKIRLQEFRLEHEHVMKGQVAYATLEDQKRALKLFENFIGGSIRLTSITPRHAEAFVAHRLSTVPSVSTVNKDIRTLRRIFNLAIEPRGYLAEGRNPFMKIKERKTTVNEIRYVEVDEYYALMAEGKTAWWCAFFSLAYGSGLRRNEVLHLTWNDVDFENQLVKISGKKDTKHTLEWDTKSRKNRVVPMTSESSQHLAELYAKAEEGFPYIFISPDRLKRIRERQRAGTWTPRSQVINNLDRHFRAIRISSGIGECTLHDLRRTAITNWAKKLPIQVVQILAGHSDIATTRKYYLAVRPEDLALANDLVDEILARTPRD